MRSVEAAVQLAAIYFLGLACTAGTALVIWIVRGLLR